MIEEERLKLENELLLTKSKAQIINLYLDELYKHKAKEYIFVGTAQLKTRDYIKALEKENRELKEGLHKILDLNKRAIRCESEKVTNQYLLKQYDLIYETLGELQPGLMKGNKK